MLVRASQPHGRLVDLTTDGMSARERIDYADPRAHADRGVAVPIGDVAMLSGFSRIFTPGMGAGP
jgi:hypothetical protein